MGIKGTGEDASPPRGTPTCFQHACSGFAVKRKVTAGVNPAFRST